MMSIRVGKEEDLTTLLVVGVRWSALKNAKVEHGDNFTVLKGPPQSSDLNAVPSISKADVTKWKQMKLD